MTSTQREARIVDSPAKTGITREAVVTKVIDQPVLDTVIEKKNVEVHHVPIVKEIHEQKIIEIEKPKQTTFVLEKPREESYVAPKIVEEINRGGLTEQERLKLASMQEVKAPLVEKMASVETIKEGEQIQSVVYQPTIERHVIPQITEIREQKVIEVVEQPITRRIIEKPIIREVGAASNVYLDIDNMPLRSMAYSYDNIPSDVLNLSYTPSGKMRSQSSMLKKRSYKLGFSNSSRIGLISAPSQSWKKDRLEIQRRYRLYNPNLNSFKFNELGQRTALQSAYDQFRSRQGYQKYRRYYYSFGKTRSTDLLKKNDPYMEYPTLLLDAWKKPEDPMLQGAFESEEETIERGPLRSIAYNIKETVVDTFNKLF